MSHIEYKPRQTNRVKPLRRLLYLQPTREYLRFWLGYQAYWNGYFRVAYNLLEPLAVGGHAAAQYYLGRMCARAEGQERDLANAIRWWNASAGAGEPWAEVAMGSLYERGKVVPRNRSKALKWYLRAAHHGLPEAQVRVGYFYEFGLGTDRDVARARRWYVEASSAHMKSALRHGQTRYRWFRAKRKRRPMVSNAPTGTATHTRRQRWSRRPHRRRSLPSR